nr:hypothetical protein [Lactobacillus helveticus]
MKHGTVTYNPHDNPAKPGEPINPNDPNSPKVTDNDVDYSKSVKETIHYVGAGDQTPSDNVQNVTLTRSITVDMETLFLLLSGNQVRSIISKSIRR